MNPAGPGLWRRGATWALALSLALNVFVGAFLIGTATRGWVGGVLDGPAFVFGQVDWTRLAERLPEEVQEEARTALEAGRREAQARLRALERSRARAFRELQRETFNREAAAAAFEQVRRETTALQEALQASLIAFAEVIPPAARVDAFAEMRE